MTYEYRCKACDAGFDVIKSYRDMDAPEACPHCKAKDTTRLFVPSRVHFIGTRVEHAEYNPGLGCVVRNKDHRRELCKAKGLQEIGNEPVESYHKHHDTTREQDREAGWDKVDAGQWVGNGQTPIEVKS